MMMMDKVLFYFTSAIRFVRALIGKKKEEGGRGKKRSYGVLKEAKWLAG